MPCLKVLIHFLRSARGLKRGRHSIFMQETINNQDQKLTKAQFDSLHLFCQQLADLLQEKGIPINVVLTKFILDTPATKDSVKTYLWKPLMMALTDKTSTKDLLKRKEIDQIWDSLNLFFGKEMGLSIPPFPSYQNKIEYN